MKAFFFRIAAIVFSVSAFLLVAEIGLRTFYPQETLHPRTGFSAKYCAIPYANTVMVHSKPGKWHYRYTTNQYHHRGTALLPAKSSARRNVVILGDSYSFGIGVNDGEEYPSILQKRLGASYGVANLSAGGWGITQEIRRFYELGILYRPREVILQFCKNDVSDNLECAVTRVVGKRFAFQDCSLGTFQIKELLSRSMIQKSQVYNFVRNAAYTLVQARRIRAATVGTGAGSRGDGMSSAEDLYIRLLEVFAQDLKEQGTRLVLLSVNGQLHEFPVLEERVLELQRANLLHYYDAATWLQGEVAYESPEGHLWGQRAHQIIGERLAGLTREAIAPH